MDSLLEFSNGFDVNLLEQVLNKLSLGTPQERFKANEVLVKLKEHNDAWRVVANILETSKNSSTRFFALQILEDTIKFRWLALPKTERDGVKNYTVNKIIELAKDDQTIKNEKVFVQKLNLVLVQILKQEWPQNWPNFIDEIISSSRTSEVLCENNMQILKLLSEEIFDFSKEDMTTDKVKTLKERLNSEFKKVFELCQMILSQSTRESLILVTLQTLLKFLSWIPLGYIFETNLLELLLAKFLPVRNFRNSTMACLTEIGSLKDDKYNEVFLKMYDHVISTLIRTLPPTTDIASAFDSAQEYDCLYIQGLSLFFSAFFSNHLSLLEERAIKGADQNNCLIVGLQYLVNISKVKDKELFKICLDYWNMFALNLYKAEKSPGQTNGLNFYGSNFLSQTKKTNPPSAKVTAYKTILIELRRVLISTMAKPEEVLVVESEDGAIIRETTKDTDAIAQYKTMRDTLVYLTHLDFDNTEDIMLRILENQCKNDFSRNKLNTLCWAVGSISGVPTTEEEKSFLVVVIKDLLTLCEMKKGKDNKAVVATNIMYVVGQYPKFLRAHWKFLKTVMNKLFEFMHELHPGVQDMACDTFLKICQKCKDQLVKQQSVGQEPFIVELLRKLPEIVSDLQPHQVQTVYESVSHTIKEIPDLQTRQNLVNQLMDPPNTSWKQIMAQANTNIQTLYNIDVIKELCKILRTNTRVCGAVGPVFVHQLGKIFIDLLNAYKTYSEYISNAVKQEGPTVTKHVNIKAMRTLKVEGLKLIETYVSISENPTLVAESIVSGLYQPVLNDYKNSVPESRNAEVLKLFAVIVDKLQNVIQPGIMTIFEAVFSTTLSMITSNFTDFPEHRLYFFKLLKAVNEHCFPTLYSVPADGKLQIVNSVIWAFKHTERNISETGLEILERMFHNVEANPSMAQEFYQRFYVMILQDILYVLTDRLHKSSFAMHCALLKKMFLLIETQRIQVKLFEKTENLINLNVLINSATTNGSFLREYVSKMLSSAFPGVSHTILQTFVNGMFDLSKGGDEQFKTHMRDFLIKLKEFSLSGDDNSKLFEEEKETKRKEQLLARAVVPGLLTEKEKKEMDEL